MMSSISEHIRQLLFEHDCVVIPEFGAFITNQAESAYDADKHFFQPNWRRPFFNRQLKNNDGMLASSLVQKEKLPYQEALNEIRRFRDSINEQLDNHRQARLVGLGNLELNHEGQITFSPDDQVNLEASTFGLPTLQVEPIESKIMEMEEKQEEEVVEEKKKKSGAGKWIAAASIVLLLAAAGFVFREEIGNNPYISNLNPFSMDSSSDASSKDDQKAEEELVEDEYASDDYVYEDESTTSETNSTEDYSDDSYSTSQNTGAVDSVYYIVVGSFQHPTYASRYERKLKNEGYSACSYESAASPYVRVCAEKHNQRFEAEERLSFIRSSATNAAWILAAAKE